MSAQVVTIHSGGEELITKPGCVSQSLVEFLEDLLERAKSGAVVGVAGTMVYPSQHGYVGVAGDFDVGYTSCFAAVGALESVKMHILKDVG